MKALTLFFLLSSKIMAFDKISMENLERYRNVFKQATYLIKGPIDDPISKAKNNKTLLEVYDQHQRLIGFIREITTTTGCDGACLPVIFTLYYDKHINLKKISSREGLTKKNHAPFTEEDYQNLELIVLSNPDIFKKVNHPKDMVDAITSATKREYRPYVIPLAAYSTLRINLYNQQTIEEIKRSKKK